MKVGIIGLGYVGLPLAVALAEAGHEVIGVDVDARIVDGLAAGRSRVEDAPAERLAALDGRLSATTDHATLAACDAVLICVPTPLANQREPDVSHIADAGRALAAILAEDQLIALESTTYPGTTRERLPPLLEESGLAAGRDFHLAYHDPYVAEIPELGLSSRPLAEALADRDVACVITAHPDVDYERAVAEAPLVVDFRGATRGIDAANLVRL